MMKNIKYNFIDIHYHSDPDLYKRRYNALDAGRLYQKLNGAVVLKSHLGSTSTHASIAQQEGLPVFPSIVLNNIIGGLNYRNVIHALAEYQPVIPSRLIVHLPTITGRQHVSKLSRKLVHPFLNEHLSQPEIIFNSENKIKKEIIELLRLAKDYPVILSTGHASREEVYALVEACYKWNVKLLLNQPANPMTGLKYEDLLELAKYKLLWIEQTALTYLLGYQDEQDFSCVLKNIPNLIYSSDLGQDDQMDIPEWINNTKKWFTQFNISTKRQEEICLIQPSRLLKIEQ